MNDSSPRCEPPLWQPERECEGGQRDGRRLSHPCPAELPIRWRLQRLLTNGRTLRTAITLAIRIRNGLYLHACHSDRRATRSRVNATSAESMLMYRDSKTVTNGRETRRLWIISGIMVTTFAMSAFAQQADKWTLTAAGFRLYLDIYFQGSFGKIAEKSGAQPPLCVELF